MLFVSVANFLLLVHAKPLEGLNDVAHETRIVTPQGWKKKDRVHKDTILPVRIGLVQKNLEKGQSLLNDVADPRSKNYGKYWSAEQVQDAFAPSAEVIKEVMEWLSSSGIPSHRVAHSKNKGWLAFDARTHEVEDLLNTNYHEHHHASGEVRVGTDKYYLPRHIQKHIDYVTPAVKLSAPLRKRSKRKAISKRQGTPINTPTSLFLDGRALSLANCDTNITTACLKALYQIPDATTASPNNSLGIFEQSSTYSQEDLDMFFTSYVPYIPNGTHPIPAFIDGATAPVAQLKAGDEPDVDLAIAISLIYPQSVTLYQTDDSVYGKELGFTGFDGLFNTFLDALDGSYCTYNAFNVTGNSLGIDPVYPDTQPGGYNGTLMCGVYTPTNVISISYGIAEADQPANYLKRQCNEFMKLGLQGHTVLAASGDFGVAADPGDGGSIGCLGGNQTIFNPETPACPYITSVGATRLYDGQSVTDEESALQVNLGRNAKLFATSGGFSNIFPLADYQAEAVNAFLSTNKFPFASYNVTAGDSVGANGGVFNVAGRGIPDVSANGAFFDSYLNGKFKSGFGTSLAAPIWGAIITLINEARIAAGKGPVGFINPVLYQHPEVFNDIRNGSNPGCHSEGFYAVDGWDPVTGLGTPNYPLLEELFLSLP